MGLLSASSKIEQSSVKGNIVPNTNITPSESNDGVDNKVVVRSIFDGKPNPSIDDSKSFRSLSSMRDWEKKDELEFSVKMYNYIKTGDMFPVTLKTESMSKEQLDGTINEYRSALDITDNEQDGIIGSFQQGTVGDCGFLSGLKVIASTKEGAKTIKNSIKNNHNKTFSVSFVGAPGKVYEVSEKELTDGKQYSTGDKDVKILEIAANKWRIEQGEESIEDFHYEDVKRLITGQDYKFYGKADFATVKPGSKNDKAVVMDKKEFLQDVPDGRFFFGSLDTGSVNECGDAICHAYFVEKKKDKLLFFNPHNTAKEAEVMSIDDFIKIKDTEIMY